MKIAALCHEKKIKFSCTRNMVINLPGESKYEVDVFFLINDTPLFIECKSGEYREFIDKYTRLRRKLFIPKPYFLMLTSGVDDERVKGLTAMFDITFVNEKMLVDYFVETFLKKQLITEFADIKQIKAEIIDTKSLAFKPLKAKKQTRRFKKNNHFKQSKTKDNQPKFSSANDLSFYIYTVAVVLFICYVSYHKALFQ